MQQSYSRISTFGHCLLEIVRNVNCLTDFHRRSAVSCDVHGKRKSRGGAIDWKAIEAAWQPMVDRPPCDLRWTPYPKNAVDSELNPLHSCQQSFHTLTCLWLVDIFEITDGGITHTDAYWLDFWAADGAYLTAVVAMGNVSDKPISRRRLFKTEKRFYSDKYLSVFLILINILRLFAKL